MDEQSIEDTITLAKRMDEVVALMRAHSLVVPDITGTGGVRDDKLKFDTQFANALYCFARGESLRKVWWGTSGVIYAGGRPFLKIKSVEQGDTWITMLEMLRSGWR